jgi:hypothetical protein
MDGARNASEGCANLSSARDLARLDRSCPQPYLPNNPTGFLTPRGKEKLILMVFCGPFAK